MNHPHEETPPRVMPDEEKTPRRDAGALPGKTPGSAEGEDRPTPSKREEPGKTPGRVEGEPQGQSGAV
jgi:hypothetical protein